MGSDAHTLPEISRVWVEVPGFETLKELLYGLQEAIPRFLRSNAAVHVITKMVKMTKKRNVLR